MKMTESTDEQGRSFRKMLIVLSDGNDTSSLVTREEALEMARRHDVTVFTVSTSAMPIQYSGKSMELQNPCKVMGQDGDKVLKRYAEATGGTAYCPFNTVDVGRSFERIANELRSQYTITYNPTNKEQVRRFREIRIGTRRKGLEVHHRPGYYARTAEDDEGDSGTP
jgi:VWFA-related protein